jgi:palmitoyltransferase
MVIERDIRMEFEGVIERLRAAEGTKLAILQHDITELQRFIKVSLSIGKWTKSMT